MIKLLANMAMGIILLFFIGGCDNETGFDTDSNNRSNKNCTESSEIWHLGKLYCPVTSPYTGRVWLDRNLGASKVCDKSRKKFANETAYTDDQQNCFGDYYQWGRNTDGHEKKESATTAEQAGNVTEVGHGKFITSGRDRDYDWAQTADPNGQKRTINWNDIRGNSICPAGYRVATLDEFRAELFDEDSYEIQKNSSEKEGNNDDRRVNAYNTFLRLPAAGYRSIYGGLPGDQGFFGDLWTVSADGAYATSIGFSENSAGWYNRGNRADGMPVRCLKD